MKRIAASVAATALLIGGVGLMIARAELAGPIFIAGDRPVTIEEVEAKLKADGWSNVTISRDGRYMRIAGYLYGKPERITLDAETGHLLANDIDDDD
jgi:hypothetical protein